jgi:hypothetical protein
MNPKNKYRVQRKLQAALTRVAEVLMAFHEAGIEPNIDATILAAAVSDALAPIVGSEGKHVPDPKDLGGYLLTKAVDAVKARRRETKRRRARRHRQGEVEVARRCSS